MEYKNPEYNWMGLVAKIIFISSMLTLFGISVYLFSNADFNMSMPKFYNNSMTKIMIMGAGMMIIAWVFLMGLKRAIRYLFSIDEIVEKLEKIREDI